MNNNTTFFSNLGISRLILGGNPFSGVSHQSSATDAEMKSYFTTANIKALLREAEVLGVTALCARADNHIIRLLREYWDEGGKIRWIAQTCPEFNSIATGVSNALAGGASAIYIHGGQMEFALANNKEDDLFRAVEQIKAAGLPAGIAGHVPPTHQWADEHLTHDFHMCSYYHPTLRTASAGHTAEAEENFSADDRAAMVATIAQLKRPAIHYKILAAGRNTPTEAFAYCANHLRADDVVCVGIYPKDKPAMLDDNVALLKSFIP